MSQVAQESQGARAAPAPGTGGVLSMQDQLRAAQLLRHHMEAESNRGCGGAASDDNNNNHNDSFILGYPNSNSWLPWKVNPVTEQHTSKFSRTLASHPILSVTASRLRPDAKKEKARSVGCSWRISLARAAGASPLQPSLARLLLEETPNSRQNSKHPTMNPAKNQTTPRRDTAWKSHATTA